MNNVFPDLRRRLYQFSDEEIGVSSIVMHELLYGIEKSQSMEKNRLKLEEFLSPFLILDFDEAAAGIAAKIKVEMQKRGAVIGTYDLFIGAHALALKTTLVTRNVSEFSRIPNLKIENWVNDAS